MKSHHIGHGFIHSGPEDRQGWGLHSLSRQRVPLPGCPCRRGTGLVRAQPPTAAPGVSGSGTCHNGRKPKAFLSPVDKYNSGTRGLHSYTSIDNVTDGLVVESRFKRERQGKSQVLPKNLGENVVLKNLIY